MITVEGYKRVVKLLNIFFRIEIMLLFQFPYTVSLWRHWCWTTELISVSFVWEMMSQVGRSLKQNITDNLTWWFLSHRFYADEDHCEKCHISCEQCSGPGPESCQACPAPLLELHGTRLCVERCPQRFYQTGQRCVQCHTSCQTCTGDHLSKGQRKGSIERHDRGDGRGQKHYPMFSGFL